jgi:hypothetical protein
MVNDKFGVRLTDIVSGSGGCRARLAGAARRLAEGPIASEPTVLFQDLPAWLRMTPELLGRTAANALAAVRRALGDDACCSRRTARATAASRSGRAAAPRRERRTCASS